MSCSADRQALKAACLRLYDQLGLTSDVAFPCGTKDANGTPEILFVVMRARRKSMPPLPDTFEGYKVRTFLSTPPVAMAATTRRR